MVSIQVKAHVGPDGVLRLKVPAEFRDTDVEARVELHPASRNGATVEKDERGWPVGFFEATAGAWEGELERGEQGECDKKGLARMIYLPDTNVCIAYLRRNNANVIRKFNETDPEDVGICDIVSAELWYGAYRSGHFLANQTLLHTFFAPFEAVPFDGRAAEVYGRIRRELEVVGTRIGPFDLQISAIALANDLTVVTHNTPEFARVGGLRIEDWEA